MRRLALLAVLLLAANVVLDGVVAAFDVVELSLLTDLMNGWDVSLDALDASDARQSAAATAGLVLVLATGAAFATWLHAVAAHVARTGRRPLRYAPAWAAGAWLVPLVNLVRPRRIVLDLWDAAAPAARGEDAAAGEWRRLVARWWAAWVAAVIGNVAVARLSTLAATADGLRTAATFDLVVVLVDLAAAVYAIRVVHALTRRQLLAGDGLEAAVDAAAAA